MYSATSNSIIEHKNMFDFMYSEKILQSLEE